jgi:hypothetical protein
MPRMRQRPVESDFEVEVFKDTVTAYFRPTRSLYTFARFATERDIAEFGPLSPDPVVQHASRGSGTRNYDSAELHAMAFRLAAEAASHAFFVETERLSRQDLEQGNDCCPTLPVRHRLFSLPQV